MHSADYAVAKCLSVRPSACVCVCHTPVLPEKAKDIITVWYSHTTLVFLYQTLWQYSDGDPVTVTGVECREGMKNCDFRLALYRK